jgi:hypothetical protein
MQSVMRFIRSPQSYALFLLICIVLPWGFAFYFGPVFEVNDDVANIIIFREVFGDGSADASIFVSAIFTHGFIFLYRVSAEIPWYPLFLFLSIFSAQLLLFHLIWQAKVNSYFKLCLFLVTSAVIFRLVLSCSFTASSLLLCSVALLYGFIGPGAVHPRLKILAMFFLVTGFLLRPGIFPVVGLAFLPVFISALMSRTVDIRKAGNFCLLVLVVVGGLYIADLAVESETRATFKQTNTIRAKFSDTSWGTITEDFKVSSFAAGWSFADYTVARNLWWFMDENIHSPQALEKFTSVNQAGRSVPWSTLEIENSLFFAKYAGCLYLILLFGWLSLANGFRSPQVWMSFAVGFLCLVLLTGIRFPPRIAYPFLLMLALAPLGTTFLKENRTIKFHWFRPVLLGLMLVPLSWVVFVEVQNQKSLKQDQNILHLAVKSGMDELLQQSPEMLFVPLPMRGFSESSFIDPFHWRNINKSLPMGWLAQSPVRQPYLKSLGFDPSRNVVPQLLKAKDVVWYFLAKSSEVRGGVLDPFMNYLNNHYGEDEGSKRLVPRIQKVKSVGSAVWLFFQVEEQK